MRNEAKMQTRGADAAGKAEKLANAPETKARFERVLKELAESFAGIFGRAPSGEEAEALRSCALISTAFLAMADDARERGQD